MERPPLLPGHRWNPASADVPPVAVDLEQSLCGRHSTPVESLLMDPPAHPPAGQRPRPQAPFRVRIHTGIFTVAPRLGARRPAALGTQEQAPVARSSYMRCARSNRWVTRRLSRRRPSAPATPDAPSPSPRGHSYRLASSSHRSASRSCRRGASSSLTIASYGRGYGIQGASTAVPSLQITVLGPPGSTPS